MWAHYIDWDSEHRSAGNLKYLKNGESETKRVTKSKNLF